MKVGGFEPIVAAMPHRWGTGSGVEGVNQIELRRIPGRSDRWGLRREAEVLENRGGDVWVGEEGENANLTTAVLAPSAHEQTPEKGVYKPFQPPALSRLVSREEIAALAIFADIRDVDPGTGPPRPGSDSCSTRGSACATPGKRRGAAPADTSFAHTSLAACQSVSFFWVHSGHPARPKKYAATFLLARYLSTAATQLG